VVSVCDTGEGIPADMLLRVFDMFRQLDTSRDRSRGGLGIGLTLVKRLVEMHGGRVEVHSDGPGKGTEFTVRLPILLEPSAGPRRQTAPADQTPLLSTQRILVVDDDQDSVECLGMMLQLSGNEVRTAHDGLEAVALADAFRPDV